MSGDAAARNGLTSDIPGYAYARRGRATIIATPEALAFVCEAIASAGSLYDYAASRPGAETIRGRSTIYLVPGPSGERWLIRRLTHGGLLAPVTGDRFLRTGTPRPFNELRLARQLRELGLPTPRVHAAAVYFFGPFYRGEVARQLVADAVDLAGLLFADPARTRPERQAALAAAGRLIGKLHRAGLAHPDLNLRNVLIENADAAPRAYILDLEKCRRLERLSAGQRQRMLRRLRRSARRFEQAGAGAIGPSEWEAFESAYAGGIEAGGRAAP